MEIVSTLSYFWPMRNWLSSLGYTGSPASFWWPPVWQLTALIALCAAAFYALADVPLWEGWKLSNVSNGEYCERLYFDRLVRQPSNSWSNFFYTFYGLLCIRFGLNDASKQGGLSTISQMPAVSWIYGFSFAYLCFGSFLFHASLTRTGQHWDMAATYGLVGVPVVFMLWRLLFANMSPAKGALVVAAAVLVADVLFYTFKWHLNGLMTLGSMITTLIVLMVAHKLRGKSYMNYWYGAAGLASVLLAYYIWHRDRDRIWCDPDSIIQGHAAWHGLTGLAAFCTYLMFRSEKPKETSKA